MKAVLFDMDGVLVFSIETWYKVFNLCLKNFGFEEITFEKFRKEVWATPIQTTAPKFFPKKKIKDLTDFFLQHFMDYKQFLKMNPDAKAVLENLKSRGIKIVLITNTFCRLAEQILDHFEIKHYFDMLITGDEVKMGKPSPEGILVALNGLGIKAQDAVFIGDTTYDIEAAKSAKVRSIGYKIEGDEKINSLVELIQ